MKRGKETPHMEMEDKSV